MAIRAKTVGRRCEAGATNACQACQACQHDGHGPGTSLQPGAHSGHGVTFVDHLRRWLLARRFENLRRLDFAWNCGEEVLERWKREAVSCQKGCIEMLL